MRKRTGARISESQPLSSSDNQQHDHDSHHCGHDHDHDHDHDHHHDHGHDHHHDHDHEDAYSEYTAEQSPRTQMLMVLGAGVLSGGLAGLLYLNSLGAEFVFDDHGAIVENTVVNRFQPWPSKLEELIERDFWGTPMESSAHKSYRPLTTLTFYGDFLRSGQKLEASKFHETNLILHALNSFLLVIISAACLFPRSWGILPPLICGVLFASHPVHTEAVSGLVGRADLLSTLFSLLSMLTYHPASSDAWPLFFRVLSFFGSLALVGASIFSKEIGLTTLAILLAMDAVHNHLNPLALFTFRKGIFPSSHRATVRALGYWMRLVAIVLFGAMVLRHRVLLMKGSPRFTASNNPSAFEPNRLIRWMTYWHVYALNVWLLLWPATLCCDWSMGSVPLVLSTSDPRNIASCYLCCILLALFVFSMVGCVQNFRRAVQGAVTMGFVMTITPFIPATNLFFPVGFVIAERILYMPSIGFCVLAAVLLHLGTAMFESRRSKVLGVMVPLSLTTSAYSLRTYFRNQDWMTSVKVFEAGVRANPLNAKLFYNLGHVSCDGVKEKAAGRRTAELKRCKKLFEEATKLSPDFSEAQGALGSLISDIDLEKGLELLELAVDLEPHSKIAQKNLGDILGRKQVDFQRSRIHLENAIRLDPNYADAHNNLGNLLLAFNEVDLVEHHYREALRINPAHPNAVENIAKFFPPGGGGLRSLNMNPKKGPGSQPSRKSQNSPKPSNPTVESLDRREEPKRVRAKGGVSNSQSKVQKSLDDLPKTAPSSFLSGAWEDEGETQRPGVGPGPIPEKKKKKETQGKESLKGAGVQAKKKRKSDKMAEPKDQDVPKGKGSLSPKQERKGLPATEERRPEDHESLKTDLLSKKMTEWTVEDYRLAIKMDPQGPKSRHYFNNLGVLLFQRGDQTGAQAMLESATKLDPSWDEARYNLEYISGDKHS